MPADNSIVRSILDLGIMPPRERFGRAQHPLGPRRGDYALQTLGFGARNPASEVGYSVVAATLVVHGGIGALVGLLDEAIREHALDRAV